MRVAPPGAARGGAIAAWGAPGVRSNHHVLGLGAARTVRFTRRAGGSSDRAAVLCRADASGGGSGEWDGRLVDEGMDTLRRRIREARAAAVSEDDAEEDDMGGADEWFPGEWTGLERQERRQHGSCYLAGAGVLRALLMRAPPGLLALLLLISVPASVLLVSAQLIRAVDSFSAALLHGRT